METYVQDDLQSHSEPCHSRGSVFACQDYLQRGYRLFDGADICCITGIVDKACVRSRPESATSVACHYGRPHSAKEVACTSLGKIRMDSGCGFRVLAGYGAGDQAADYLARRKIATLDQKILNLKSSKRAEGGIKCICS